MDSRRPADSLFQRQQMELVWILVIGVAGMMTAFALVTAWERRRARMLKEAGMALGLRPLERGEPLRVPSVEIMRKRRRSIGAAVEGHWRGAAVTVFDLSYPVGKSTSQTTVFVFRLPQPRLPEFAAIHKNLWLYTPTVDLERVQGPPQSLRRHWYLYTRDGSWPLGNDVDQWLAANEQWSFEGRGSGLFLYRRSKRAPARHLQAWLDEALAASYEFIRRVPRGIADTTPEVGEPVVTRKVLRFKASVRIG
jgi:hypothetical protein